MGLLNFFKPKQPESTGQANPEVNDNAQRWAANATVAFAGDQIDEKEQAAKQLKKHEDKLIAAALYGPKMFGAQGVEITAEDHDKFLDSLQSGEYSSPDKQSQLLRNIVPPVGQPGHEDYGPVMVKISGKQPAKIMAYALRGSNGANQIRGEQRIDNMFQHELQMFMGAFPTPVELAPVEQQMMNALAIAGNGPDKLQEYRDSFEHFKQSVYGKRYEYYQALESLQGEAQSRAKQQADAENEARILRERQQMIRDQQDPEFQARYIMGRSAEDAAYSAPETRPDDQYYQSE